MNLISMTLENILEKGNVQGNYLCLWKKMVESPKVVNEQCLECYGENPKCKFYMPLCEIEEYFGKN